MKNILIVEDKLAWRKWIAHILADTETVLVFKENGQLAVDEIERNSNYDAIVMNVRMPIMDGYTATQKIRALGYTKPIIGNSSWCNLECVRMAFKAGMSHYLLRTGDNRNLRHALDHIGVIKSSSNNLSNEWNNDFFFTNS